MQLMRSGLHLKKYFGGLAQLARASALHAEGHRFDSDILHQSGRETKRRERQNKKFFTKDDVEYWKHSKCAENSSEGS